MGLVRATDQNWGLFAYPRGPAYRRKKTPLYPQFLVCATNLMGSDPPGLLSVLRKLVGHDMRFSACGKGNLRTTNATDHLPISTLPVSPLFFPIVALLRLPLLPLPISTLYKFNPFPCFSFPLTHPAPPPNSHFPFKVLH